MSWGWPKFETPIGQLGRVPLFGARPRRYIRSWLFNLGFTVFWRPHRFLAEKCVGRAAPSSGPSPDKKAFDPSPLRNFRMAHSTQPPDRSNSYKPLLPQPWQPQRISASYHRAGTLPTRTERGTKGGTKAPPAVPRRMHGTRHVHPSAHSLPPACS